MFLSLFFLFVFVLVVLVLLVVLVVLVVFVIVVVVGSILAELGQNGSCSSCFLQERSLRTLPGLFYPPLQLALSLACPVASLSRSPSHELPGPHPLHQKMVGFHRLYNFQ